MAQNTEINKAELAQYVVELQNGDKRAFEKIYNVTYRSGYFTALKILQDEGEAQDVLQDSYVAVLEHIGEVQDADRFLGWFHQIVANRAKKCLSKRKPALFTSAEAEQEFTGVIQDEDIAVRPEQKVDDDDVHRLVMRMIDNLTDEKRTCVLLYYYNEMHVPEIAQAVGASVNTVKARLFQARKELRQEIELLSRRKVALRGAAPASVVVWALRAAAQVETASFASSSAAVVVMESAAATASAAIAAAGTAAAGTAAVGSAAGTAAASATGFLAKLAAMTVVQKVAVGVITVGVVAGAATGTATVVNNVIEKKAEETTEEQAYLVETVEETREEKYNITMPTPPSSSRPTMADYGARSTMTRPEQRMQSTQRQAETQAEPVATTAAVVEETTAAANENQGTPNQQQNGNPFIPNNTGGSSAPAGNTRPNGRATTKPATTPSTAAQTAATTAAQQNNNSGGGGGGSYTPVTQSQASPTAATVTSPPTVPTTLNQNADQTAGASTKATVRVKYTDANGEVYNVSGTVNAGETITVNTIKTIVQNNVPGASGAISVDSVVGQTASAGQTYNYDASAL